MEHATPPSVRRRRRPPNGPQLPSRPLQEDGDEEDISPFVSERYVVRRKADAFRRVQRVSRHAALATKQVVWDSNDASIDAALSAVDHWEGAYVGLRGILAASLRHAKGFYGAAKEGAGKLEDGFLMPVRDWILLPAFGGVERAASESVRFLQSEHARQLAGSSLELATKVPFVGDNVLAPAMCFSVGFVQRTWEIVQYPIPSKQQVRDSVDFTLNGTKWALTSGLREVYMYLKRADAIISRTLSHTQWKVLGSGPYATLDKLNKREVIDHLCERYFSLEDAVARYEFAAHIRARNQPLYHDLVLTGVLKDRGGNLTTDDEWLSTCPVYRALESPFLVSQEDDTDLQPNADYEMCALWFRLPYLNGKRPGNDAPWICFSRKEQRALEERFLDLTTRVDEEESRALPQLSRQETENPCESYPTVAKWFSPDGDLDVLVDEDRHAVSFYLCCPACQKSLEEVLPPVAKKKYGDFCSSCEKKGDLLASVAALTAAPQIAAAMRPTFWRFYGPGDEVRRSTWFLDTARNGLQPFGDSAQAVLEDAYLFLKWMALRQIFEQKSELDAALLTVEVPCPDGIQRLVQFSSLTAATAIKKGVGAAMSVFKRRVYRGAWLLKDGNDIPENSLAPMSVEESIIQAVKDNGSLGDTMVPDANMRSVLTPPRRHHENPLVPYIRNDDVNMSMAVPPLRLAQEDTHLYVNENKEEKVDHLVLVVHGIGEMLRSTDVFGLALPNLGSIVDCCSYMRKNHCEVQDAHFSQMYPSADSSSRATTGRVEYLPVEWHEAFSILSQRRPASDEGTGQKLNVTIKDISLRTIPNMRDFANDALMDVLYFMNPEHHDVIIDLVTNEMNTVFEKFSQITGFSGRISVCGHSLGSIIAFDILANQQEIGDHAPLHLPSNPSFESLSPTGYLSPLSERVSEPEITSSSTSPLSQTTYPQLNFAVDNFFLLGSPVAVFLMIRNKSQPLAADFCLSGCRRVFNIFHPYDPVAYRIEPCLSRTNADFEPIIMKHWNGGFRVQYQTKRLWRKLVDKTWKTQQDVVEAFEGSMAAIGLLDSRSNVAEDDEGSEVSSDDNRPNRVVTGMLNEGRRIDFMLQEKEIENANEYVAALAAHSSYWIEKDLSLFFARQIYLSNMEHAAEAEALAWEPILPSSQQN